MRPQNLQLSVGNHVILLGDNIRLTFEIGAGGWPILWNGQGEKMATFTSIPAAQEVINILSQTMKS